MIKEVSASVINDTKSRERDQQLYLIYNDKVWKISFAFIDDKFNVIFALTDIYDIFESIEIKVGVNETFFCSTTITEAVDKLAKIRSTTTAKVKPFCGEYAERLNVVYSILTYEWVLDKERLELTHYSGLVNISNTLHKAKEYALSTEDKDLYARACKLYYAVEDEINRRFVKGCTE